MESQRKSAVAERVMPQKVYYYVQVSSRAAKIPPSGQFPGPAKNWVIDD